MKNNIKKYGHPMTGKHHTKESKELNRKAHYKTGTCHCIECKKDLNHHHWEVQRCNSCAKKEQYRINPETHPNLGKKQELASSWKGGKPKCKICNKQLINYSAKYCKKHYGLFLRLSNNPSWNGGSSFSPYSLEWTKELKETIRKRDNYRCAICHNFSKDVHHIDYDKNNCACYNLITLCHKHHSSTNYNRDYWYAYFTYKMEVFNDHKRV